MRTSELQGAALDWAVAKAMGEYKPTAVPNYSTDWSQGGPIIEREGFGVFKYSSGPEWTARTTDYPPKYVKGPTPLIAAMRCYVASKLGGEVEVPDELLQGEQA